MAIGNLIQPDELQPLWGDVYVPKTIKTGTDLLRLPHDRGTFELYEGVVIHTMTSPGHGGVCTRLIGELYLYLRTHTLPNQIVDNTLFDLTLPDSPHRTVFAPDVAVLRENHALMWNITTDTPLIAIEVLSSAQTMAELQIKAQHYRQTGVDEVWLVDHSTRTVAIWNQSGTTMLTDAQMLTSPLLPSFTLAIAYLLDG